MRGPAAVSVDDRHAAGSDGQQATDGAVGDSVAHPGGSQAGGRAAPGRPAEGCEGGGLGSCADRA
ncbi:hypothetical protein SCATT_p10700 (plasmid) [Streptantibioticus cattleyicolor NRRL 8057 = DSM 46488]|uniref:Uncharacterized protein n=1 Tax=Streptantibioticus cattleyicolor (strain ATCC 35852 / DSM 46488 / JCM 4925 / NBRC 14057 / NRRL 8057) TaxID=1003195 RepID=G8XEA9_STREN|nr:hypothetical protein SCATT_p10700 [Streptantibioticus cattleyicolor NRRL 8057 = DSM 46488]